MKISFGKYKGREVEQVPSSYLNWYISNFNIEDKLSKEYILYKLFLNEYRRRDAYRASVALKILKLYGVSSLEIEKYIRNESLLDSDLTWAKENNAILTPLIFKLKKP